MKINKLDCCVKSILYNFIDFSWFYRFIMEVCHCYFLAWVRWENITSTNINCSTNMKMRNVETITHTSFSLKLFIWYIITKTVWFYNYMYIQFSQASITRNTISVNWFPISLNFRHPLESKGCLKFIQRFPWIDFHHFIINW